MQIELRRCQDEVVILQNDLEAEKDRNKKLKSQVNQKTRKNAKLQLKIVELEEMLEEAQAKVNSGPASVVQMPTSKQFLHQKVIIKELRELLEEKLE